MFITIASTTSDQHRIAGFYDTLDQDHIARTLEGIADIHLYCFDGDAFDSDVTDLAAEIRTGLDTGDFDPADLWHYTEALGITITTHPAKV